MSLRFRHSFRISARGGLPLVVGAALLASPAPAAPPDPVQARAGLELALAASYTWAADAFLAYVENDEPVDAGGAARRWGYLFYSPSLDKARGYSVRGGRIVVAEDLPLKFEAPPISSGWIDSGRALEAAERAAGRAFRQRHQGALATMLLLRGAFQDNDPDATTWTLVYTAPNAAPLFVVVDAEGGKVRRTWRG
jgi:hypothetical protein